MQPRPRPLKPKIQIMEKNPSKAKGSETKNFQIKTKNDKKLKISIDGIPPTRPVQKKNIKPNAKTIHEVLLELQQGKKLNVLSQIKMETIPETLAAAKNPEEEAKLRERFCKEVASSRSIFHKDPADDNLIKEEVKFPTVLPGSPLYPLVDIHEFYIVQQEKPNEFGLPWYGVFNKHGEGIFHANTINRIRNPRSKNCPTPYVSCFPCCFGKDLQYEITLYDENDKDFCKVVVQPHKKCDMPSEIEIYIFDLFMATIKSNIQYESNVIQNVYDIYDGHGRMMGYCSPELLNDHLRRNVATPWLSVSLYKTQQTTSTWTGMIRRNFKCTRQYELLCPKLMRPEQKLIMVILMMFLLVEDYCGYRGRSHHGR